MLASQKDNIWSSASAALIYFKLFKEVYAKVGLHQLDFDGCVFVKYSQDIKAQPPLSVENTLESGAFKTMDTVPKIKVSINHASILSHALSS